MKVEIIKEFHDINDFAHVFDVGEVVDVDNVRADKWIAIGVAKKLSEAKPAKSKKADK